MKLENKDFLHLHVVSFIFVIILLVIASIRKNDLMSDIKSNNEFTLDGSKTYTCKKVQ